MKWMRPEVFYRTVDVYHVQYRARQARAEMEWEQQVVETVINTINHMVGESLAMLINHMYLCCRCTRAI